MKKHNLLKKRDGQGWNAIGYYYSSSYNEACKEFTKAQRNDLAIDCSFIHVNDEEFREMQETNNSALVIIDYSKPGYYRIDGTGSDELFDDQIIEHWNDDVYSWKVES